MTSSGVSGRAGPGLLAGAMLAVLMMAVVVSAQSRPGTAWADGKTAATLPPTTRPSYSRVDRVTEDLFDRSRRPVILLPAQPGEVGQNPEQRSEGTRKKLTPDIPLLPQGYVLASRESTVTRDGDWYVIQPLKAKDLPDSPPLRVLPNQQLAMLQSVLSQLTAAPTFLVTGRITEFLGANYILLEGLEEVLPAAAQTASAGEPGVETTTEPAPSGPGREPTAEEILKKLLSRPTRRSVALPQLTTSPSQGVRPRTTGDPATSQPESASGLLPEPSILIDRAGRVLPGEKWWSLVFENKGQRGTDKPIRLLPNRQLETAIALSGGGTQGAVFVVSGEVTTCENVNYLLLGKVLLRRNLGNIR